MKRKDFIKDAYAQRAQQTGIRARSYYKLEELDTRFKLLRPRQCILDLGAHPGGWLQYLAKRTAGNCNVVAVDVKPVTVPAGMFKDFSFLERDVQTLQPAELNKRFHGVLSDLAPPTTGVRSNDAVHSYELVFCALTLAVATLNPRGFFVAKYYAGGQEQELLAKLKQYFEKVTLARPQATRSRSREVFLVAREFKHPNLD